MQNYFPIAINFLGESHHFNRKSIYNFILETSLKTVNFTLKAKTDAYFACSVVFQDKTLVMGGKNEPNQVFMKYLLSIINVFLVQRN